MTEGVDLLVESIEIVDYDPEWPQLFARVKDEVLAAMGPLAYGIEHVGSTAVRGLAGKPIVDIDVVVRSAAEVPAGIKRLESRGYVHEGNLGVPGRQSFKPPPDLPYHHLYLCPRDSEALRHHLYFRDYLRAHPEVARQYGELKRAIAWRVGSDRTSYTEAKTAFIEEILNQA